MTVTGPGAAAPTPTAAWTWGAAFVAVVALVGSLYLSMGMHLKACPLCFYQRTFIMGVVGVLGVGLCTGADRRLLSLLALPMAVGGLTVAAFHTYLEMGGVLECPLGVAGLSSAPRQSLAIHIVLLGFLGMDLIKQRQLGPAVGAAILGVILAGAGIQSVPSTPVPDYTKPVDEDGCRKKKS